MPVKYQRGILIVFAIFLLCLHSRISFSAEKASPEDQAAIVNGAVITKKEMNFELNQFQQRFARAGRSLNDAQVSQLKQEVLENLISRELVFQESRKNNIFVDESKITDYLKSMKSRFPGEAEYRQELQKMNVTEDVLRSTIRKEMAVNQFIEMTFASKIIVSDEESRGYYERNPKSFMQPQQVKASHILIRVDPKATVAQKKEALVQIEKIQQRIKDGEDFGSLALVHSQDPSRSKRGDLGYFAHRNMVKPFADAAFGLKIGEVSPVVETQFGYHLIKVFDKRADAKVEYENVRGKIEQFLKRDTIREQVKKLLEKIKKTAVVEKVMQ
ncbi:MAG: peptidylprolyl isomerase [Desulfobacterales bacterium]|nr:peptidylprolyl isomerase [Desulfobacterales bacterium]